MTVAFWARTVHAALPGGGGRRSMRRGLHRQVSGGPARDGTRPVIRLALALLLAAGAAGAETRVRLDRAVPDAVFHLAVACAAPPGGGCRAARVAWGPRARADLRVAVMPADPGYPAAKAAVVAAAVAQAVDEVNGAGAGIRLRLVDPGERPHIRVFRSRLREGQRTQGVPGFPDGTAIGVGQFQIWWDGNRVLERASVLVSADIRPGEIRSVVLEEIVQALGLWHDVVGAGYAGRSIFDNDSNAVVRLAGQDAAILRLHYPPR